MKIIVCAFFASLLGLTAAWGQAGNTQPDPNDPYITSTGETVPNPGQSQSGGTTKLDRGIQRQDNKIDNSICKGC